MAGRRRRPSNSAVATVEELHHRYLKETNVLKPTSPNTPDNEWPCYVLTDAMVYRSDCKTPANPLHVHLEGPMVIRGTLQIDEADTEIMANLIKPNKRVAHIEISRSERYSIGYLPNTLWVSGAAGWFEILPAPEYESTYREVQEAIALYYGILDAYEPYDKALKKNMRKKKKPPVQPSLDEIFFKYALTVGDGVFRDEVEARCKKWAQFLISHFPKEAELLWDNTDFAKWLRGLDAVLTKRIADAAAGLIPPTPIFPALVADVGQASQSRPISERSSSRSRRASRRNSDDEDVEMTDLASGPSNSPPLEVSEKGKGKAKLQSSTPVPLPDYMFSNLTQRLPTKPSPAPKESPTPDAADMSPVERLVDVFREMASEFDIKKASASKVYGQVHFKCKVKKYGNSQIIVHYYSKELLQHLDPEWRGTMFYKWLEEVSQRPVELPEDLPEWEIPSQLVRRKVKSFKPRASAKGPATDTLTPSNDLPKNKSRKSIPRTTLKWEDDEQSEEDPPRGKHLQPLTGTRTSGKGAVLRLAGSSKKRPVSEMEEDLPSGGGAGRKEQRRRVSRRNRPYAHDEDDTSEDDSLVNEDVEVISTSGRGSVPAPQDAVRIVVHAEKLPTMSPVGPNGTWTCDQDQCGFVVRSAEEMAGQERIHEHFRWHESQVEKINLAVTESRGGDMPIKYASFPRFKLPPLRPLSTPPPRESYTSFSKPEI
ncbi:hypothetical protein B0H66DRAFT_617285 [Apodospora peruviana]|uniref:Uncharacterized protein n=1 Tax=Apodospora peruviana TaxID=516989 RepID=A0AAE0IJW8_9PEZI|nr:hypothetical protein B0H66DRAFT_617285 [Apodospora peruviana]